MQIILMDKTYQCENQIAAVEAVLNEVNQVIAKSEKKLSCLEIDGIKVYDNYGQYILSKLAEINTIVVLVKPLSELLGDTFHSTQEYLTQAIPEIKRIADEFYQGAGKSTWRDVSQLMEGLQFILDMLGVIQNHQALCFNAPQFAVIAENMLAQVVVLQEAMENQDRVVLGDNLQYVLVPLLEELYKEINRKEH